MRQLWLPLLLLAASGAAAMGAGAAHSCEGAQMGLRLWLCGLTVRVPDTNLAISAAGDVAAATLSVGIAGAVCWRVSISRVRSDASEDGGRGTLFFAIDDFGVQCSVERFEIGESPPEGGIGPGTSRLTIPLTLEDQLNLNLRATRGYSSGLDFTLSVVDISALIAFWEVNASPHAELLDVNVNVSPSEIALKLRDLLPDLPLSGVDYLVDSLVGSVLGACVLADSLDASDTIAGLLSSVIQMLLSSQVIPHQVSLADIACIVLGEALRTRS